MKKLFLIFGLLTGCGPSMILLVHPKTGERVECRAPMVWNRGLGTYVAASEVAVDCAQQYEGLGFVRAEKLAPEQRATLISKPRPIEVQQDITIRESEIKK